MNAEIAVMNVEWKRNIILEDKERIGKAKMNEWMDG